MPVQDKRNILLIERTMVAIPLTQFFTWPVQVPEHGVEIRQDNKVADAFRHEVITGSGFMTLKDLVHGDQRVGGTHSSSPTRSVK